MSQTQTDEILWGETTRYPIAPPKQTPPIEFHIHGETVFKITQDGEFETGPAWKGSSEAAKEFVKYVRKYLLTDLNKETDNGDS